MRRILLFASFLLLTVCTAKGKVQTVFERCCHNGEIWTESNQDCKGYSFPFHGVNREDQDMCRWSFEICCLRKHRKSLCETGKQTANSGKTCAVLPAVGGEAHKDCCDACKLGIVVSARRGPCVFDRFKFSEPWDEAFTSCCNQGNEETIPFEQSASGSDGGNKIAWPTQEKTSDNDCGSHNPCEHICRDDGGPDGIKCSCRPGYRLNRNKFSCEDIDECSEKADTCQHNIERCQNSPGGYHCISNGNEQRCPTGYVFNTTKRACGDVDECKRGTDTCDLIDQTCVNNAGSFDCIDKDLNTFHQKITCPAGFKDNSLNGCIDVDECEENIHNCDPDREVCLNSYGAYHCQSKQIKVCPAGYKRELEVCTDVDECSEKRHACQNVTEECVNTAGGYNCEPSCANGLKYDPAQKGCIDINECVESPYICQRNEICENTLGSYICKSNRLNNNNPNPRRGCPHGYGYDSSSRECEDLNECQLGSHGCEDSQRCDNTIGSFICVRVTDCGTGYTLNAQSGRCEDDDECTLNPNTCGRDYICRNTEGSFRCDRTSCAPNERLLNDGLCHPLQCGEGMEIDEQGICSDVNECATSNPCRHSQTCVNTPGSYRCQNNVLCGGGYELNTVRNQCVDIDECDKGLHECSSNQICRNKPGGYSCECPTGYALNSSRACEDIDECSRSRDRVCSINSECHNTPGSYICGCKTGFRKSAASQNCADIDECEETRNLCQHKCENTWGSFVCTCKAGFNLGPDKRSCQDIDECSLYKDKGHLCFGFCVNEPGSFSCSCPEGYRLAADTRTCQDINECQEQQICQDENQLCLNTRGGYKCNNITCPQGYSREKGHRSRCKRTNLECLRGDSDCLKEPISISFNYLTMASKMRIPNSGQLDLFTMRGPRFSFTNVQFSLELRDSRAPGGVVPAAREDFHIRRTSFNEAMISMVKSLTGPQEIELELIMKMYHDGRFGGTAIAKLFIYVSHYDF